mgnify:CR=1 FL=1
MSVDTDIELLNSLTVLTTELLWETVIPEVGFTPKEIEGIEVVDTDIEVEWSAVATTVLIAFVGSTTTEGPSPLLIVRLIASAIVYSVINSVTSSLTTKDPVRIVV